MYILSLVSFCFVSVMFANEKKATMAGDRVHLFLSCLQMKKGRQWREIAFTCFCHVCRWERGDNGVRSRSLVSVMFADEKEATMAGDRVHLFLSCLQMRKGRQWREIAFTLCTVTWLARPTYRFDCVLESCLLVW